MISIVYLLSNRIRIHPLLRIAPRSIGCPSSKNILIMGMHIQKAIRGTRKFIQGLFLLFLRSIFETKDKSTWPKEG